MSRVPAAILSVITVCWIAILTTVGLGVALGVVVGVSLLLATLAYCRKCELFK